jgi:hypothetical protein
MRLIGFAVANLPPYLLLLYWPRGHPRLATITLGIVTRAERAHVGLAAASEASTIYNGDRLSTEVNGAMRISSPGLTLRLDGQSALVLRRLPSSAGEIRAELASGTLVFAAARTANIIVVADDALVRPSTNASAIAHVSVVNARELRIYAQHGSLDFSYRGTSETIPEGSAYKVLLDPSEKEARLSESDKDGKRPPAIHHPTFVLIAIGVAVGVGILLLLHSLESPDRPEP